jgi:uncharacterized protein (TIGR01319 family)
MACDSRYVIVIDFGSTYTKIAIVDMFEKKFLKTDNFSSTVSYDARIGLMKCFDVARESIGEEEFEKAYKIASSSAAGGLRMGVVGLSKTLSLEAGRNAAFGAGAKILKSTNGLLTEEDLNSLYESSIEILLFCGGYEKGNKSILKQNAETLGKSKLQIPIIYAGNSEIAPEIRRIFTLNKKEFYVASNIIPEIGVLDKVGVENIIREIFLKRIVNMKGLDKVVSMLDEMLMPTPSAVLQAGNLLSKGTENHEGLGDLMIVDVGGATTDIHSYAEQISYEGAKLVGIAEPYVKRTVEGDLGMRESSNTLVEEIGLENMCISTKSSAEEVNSVINKWVTYNKELAESDIEKKVDQALAKGAVRISARRHAGQIEYIASAGLKTVQHGKNLSKIKTVIGTGGPIIFGNNPKEIISQVLRNKSKEPDLLLPEDAEFYLDKDYLLFVGGLLSEIDKDVAFLIMKNNIKKI